MNQIISPHPSLEKRGMKGSIFAPPFLKGVWGIMGKMLVYNPGLKRLSQELRRNMTDAERLVWSRIRGKQLKGVQVYRQRIIGNYIVDFYCPKAKLVIEIDGGEHYKAEGAKKDEVRDASLRSNGLSVLRFSDIDVLLNIEAVIEKIHEEM